MKRLIILVMLGISSISFSHRSRDRISKPSGYGGTNLKIPLCKNQYEREKAFGEFKNQLISNGYTIVRVITSDVSFDILVRDSAGNEHWESKDWCKF